MEFITAVFIKGYYMTSYVQTFNRKMSRIIFQTCLEKIISAGSHTAYLNTKLLPRHFINKC